MESKKNTMKFGKVITTMIVALFCVVGFGCAGNESGSTSVKVGPDGTEVNVGGVNVKTDSDGVQVNAEMNDGAEVPEDDGSVRVNTGNVNVETGKDGVKVDM